MSTRGNTAKQGASTQQHSDSTKRSIPGWERTYNALVSILLSQHSSPLCQPGDRSSVAASLNDDLAVISDWCFRWGMLVNPSKTRGMLISRSRTVEPLFPDLVIDGSVVEMVSELKILGVILDSKLTFEKQVRAIAASASMRVGILRKTMSVFRDVAIVAK